MARQPEELSEVLAKAAELQRIVPGAVLVGGAAAALHAGHRLSFDHDHVVADLTDRFDTVLDHLDALADWSLARARPGKVILGSLGGIESGIRQMIRSRPLEVEHVDINGADLVVPTARETLRIKAWLVLSRNQARDHLDVAALADLLGVHAAAETLGEMDAYYADVAAGPEPVTTQLVRQLSNPMPRDERTTRELSSYKRLDSRFHEWSTIVAILRSIADHMVRTDGDDVTVRP
jgi:hypothetical protein